MGILDEIISDSMKRTERKGGVLDSIFNDSLKPAHKESVDVQRHWEETESTSAITGQKIRRFTGEGGQGASFGTHLKAGFVDDPITKMQIYASDRFPDLSAEEAAERYRIQNGEVLYRGDDGKWYSESPDLFHLKMKRFLGETAAHSPAIALGTAGEVTLGMPGAMIGSGAGEAIRTGVGKFVFGEDVSGGKALERGLSEAGMGALGVLPGRATVKVGRKTLAISGGRKGMRVVKAAGKDLPTIDFKKAYSLKKQYKDQFGVELFDAQTTGSRRLLDKINLYGDIPATADLVAAAKEIQDEQVYNAVQKYFDDLAPVADAFDIGGEVSAAAQKSIDREIGKRMARARPFYQRAFSKDTRVDITPHIREIDSIIEEWPLDSPERKKLVGFRNMLFKKGKKSAEVSSGRGPSRFAVKPKTTTTKVPEDRLKVLDRLKKSTDSYLKPSPTEPSVTREVKRDIRRVKNNILADLDKASPDYQKARQVWADDSKAIERLTNKTRLKKIADYEGEEVIRATRDLFSNINNSPELVRMAKDRIMREDPSAWRKALRIHIEDLFEKTKGSAAGGAQDSAKRYGAFWRNTVGDPKQRKLLQAAMSKEQWQSFSALTDMMRRASWIARRESTTATRQMSLQEEAEGLGRSLIKAWAYPLITFRKVLWDKFRQLETDLGKKRVAEALLDTRASRQILKIRRMGINTEKGIRAFSTFLSLVLGGEYSRHGSELLESYKEERRR